MRDRLLGRPTDDYDIAVLGDARRLARALARSTDAHVFALSDAFGVWRVVDRDRRWQVDVLPVIGESIEADLAGRDFTINAIAESLGGGREVDPFGGVSDLRARRLRMVSARAFSEDPLRVMRLARLACELGFEVDEATVESARASAGALDRVAPERVFAELKRVLVADGALAGLKLMDAVGATDVVLPELRSCAGSSRAPITISTSTSTPGWSWPRRSRSSVSPTVASPTRPTRSQELLPEPLANELSRGQALRFGALFTMWPSRRPGA